VGEWGDHSNRLPGCERLPERAHARGVPSHGGPPPEKAVFWFFTTTIGKDTYATVYTNADFRKEGAFEKWNKGGDRGYWIFPDGGALLFDTKRAPL
jgi:hypothetical protein